MDLPMNDAILDVQGLIGGYGKMTILNGTSFSVPAGSITTLIGPNGAGKSTVFKAIFGLLKLREGRILFRGCDVTGLNPRQLLAAGICYVPQGRNIFPELSVRHNIELGAAAAERDITDLAARIEAALDRFFAADGAADFCYAEGITRPRCVDSDDRAECAIRTGDLRFRHRARTRPDPPGRQGRAGAGRSPHRAIVPRRRHDCREWRVARVTHYSLFAIRHPPFAVQLPLNEL